MNSPFHVVGIAPIIAVASVRASIDFYVRHLGFEETFVAEDGDYGIVTLQEHSVHFALASDADALAGTAKFCSFRLRVRNLDAYWKQVAATHPPTRSQAPETKPWGVREFHILDIDGALLMVTEEFS